MMRGEILGIPPWLGGFECYSVLCAHARAAPQPSSSLVIMLYHNNRKESNMITVQCVVNEDGSVDYDGIHCNTAADMLAVVKKAINSNFDAAVEMRKQAGDDFAWYFGSQKSVKDPATGNFVRLPQSEDYTKLLLATLPKREAIQRKKS